MVRGLHNQKTWEELAEDPFRGLRAGPVTFSPFLCLPAKTPKNLKMAISDTRLQLHPSKKTRKSTKAHFAVEKCGTPKSELTAKPTVRLAGLYLVQRGAWNNPPA
jgi:hypothetical protein